MTNIVILSVLFLTNNITGLNACSAFGYWGSNYCASAQVTFEGPPGVYKVEYRNTANRTIRQAGFQQWMDWTEFCLSYTNTTGTTVAEIALPPMDMAIFRLKKTLDLPSLSEEETNQCR